MALDVTSTVNSALAWSALDTGNLQNQSVIDNSTSSVSQTYVTGTGLSNTVNFVYLDSQVFASGESTNYDLFNLSRSLLNGTITLDLSGGYIKGLQVNNVSTGVMDIFVHLTGSTAWNNAFNSDDVNLRIRPDSHFSYSYNYEESANIVNTGNRYIRVGYSSPLNQSPTVGENAKCEIAIIAQV